MKPKSLRNMLAIGLIVTLTMLSFSGCGGQSPSEVASDANVGSQGGPLIMATESGFAPYQYLEGTQIVGVDVDIANEIAKELGKELEIVDMAFDAIPEALNTGRADIGAAGISITEERKQKVDFSIEYATTYQRMIVLKDSGIQSSADLVGKTIAVQQGTVAEFETEKHIEDIQILPSKKYFEAMNNLKTGRADAVVLDELPAQELLQMGDEFIMLEETLFTDSYAIAVKKGNQELLDVVNKVLQRLIDEGKIEEFTKNHLS